MTFSSKKRLAFQYGRQAARKRERFAPALDPKMQQPVMKESEHIEALYRAWFRGYAMQMQADDPDIGEAITVILRELYATPPIEEWSEQARSAKSQLEAYGI